MQIETGVDNRPVTGSGKAPGRKLGRSLTVALVVLGVVTFIIAVLSLVLTARARDFCDSTCNQSGDHLWGGLSAIAALSSLVQIFAAANRSWRVALGAFGVTFLFIGIPILLVIVFS